MADEPTNEDGEGKVLPAREMMSLISTDPVPVDPVYSTIVPAEQTTPADGPLTAETPPGLSLPVEPPTEGSSESTSETISQQDEASAG
jgi:hypothetical protein